MFDFEHIAFILHILKYIEVIISVISVFIVMYGTVAALVALLKTELFRLKSKYNIQRLRVIRADLGTYLLLALELLIAADIIKSIVEPGLIDLGVLAGIVAIRNEKPICERVMFRNGRCTVCAAYVCRIAYCKGIIRHSLFVSRAFWLFWLFAEKCDFCAEVRKLPFAV